MGLVGFEPTISPLWAARFNQLNYKPNRISTCPSEWTSRVDLCSYSFFGLFPCPPSVGFFLCEALHRTGSFLPTLGWMVDFFFATSVSPSLVRPGKKDPHSFSACGETRPGWIPKKKSEFSFMLHRDKQLPVKTKWVGQEEVGGSGGENGVRTRDFWRDRPAL